MRMSKRLLKAQASREDALPPTIVPIRRDLARVLQAPDDQIAVVPGSVKEGAREVERERELLPVQSELERRGVPFLKIMSARGSSRV